MPRSQELFTRREFGKKAVGAALVTAGVVLGGSAADAIVSDPPLMRSDVYKYKLGGGGGASRLSQLQDVQYPSSSHQPNDAEVLTFIAAENLWEPRPSHLRLHDHSNALDGTPIAVAGVPDLPAAKITSGRFGMPRMPDGTLAQYLRASGAGADPAFAQPLHPELGGVTANQHHAQSHVLDPGDHTISGKTAGQFLRATSATVFAFEAVPFSVEGTVLSPTGAINVIVVLRFSFACTVTALKGWRVGGTGATVNAGKGTTATPTSKILASDLSLTSAETAMDGGSVQNTAFAVGDPLILIIASITGSPTQIGIQVDFTRP